jgi:hypothetical protein
MISNLWDYAQRTGQPAVREAAAAPISVQSALDTIVNLIPADVIGIYLALVGLFGQSWCLFWIGAALIPILLTIAHFERKKDLKTGEQPPPLSKLVLVVLFAFVAYVPWAATLPNTPFLEFHEHATKFSAGAALVLSAFLPRLARLLGIAG